MRGMSFEMFYYYSLRITGKVALLLKRHPNTLTPLSLVLNLGLTLPPR